MSKISIESIKQQIEPKGWKLLSTSYKNLDTLMDFECPEGHTVVNSYRKMRSSLVCPICSQNPLTSVPKEVPKTDKFRILALDQATIKTGWSLWDGNELVEYGLLATNEKKDTIYRIEQARQWLLSMIQVFQPDLIVLEDIQMQSFKNDTDLDSPFKNHYGTVAVTTFKSLAQLQGVLWMTAIESNIECKLIPSSTWRAGVGVKGSHRVDKKRSAQLLVKQYYDVSVSEDEADAICLGWHASKTCYKKVNMLKWG